MVSGRSKRFIGCDWGSSNFRLALVGEDGTAAALVSDDGGISALRRQGAGRQEMLRHLAAGIHRLAATSGLDLSGMPVVISGMAGSSIGIIELPYARLPFSADGSDAILRRLAGQDEIPHDCWFISGVCGPDDVMRGEETEAVGLLQGMQLSGSGSQDACIILPGTHSKHLEFRGGRFVALRTYMTGELFSVIASHTILAASIQTSDEDDFDDTGRSCFLEGLELSANGDLLHELFRIRSRHLLGDLPVRGNVHRLSGLLIGQELQRFKTAGEMPLLLAGIGRLHDLYACAVDHIRPMAGTIQVPDFIRAESVWMGQRRSIAHHLEV